MLKNSFVSIWVVLFALFSCDLLSQRDISISNITKREGLNFNRVISIAQDSAGVIWMGLFGNGLATYDGKRIRRVVLEGEERFGSKKQMFVSDSKRLYINSINGLEIFDPITEEIKDTLQVSNSSSDFTGFDQIKMRINGSDTLIWGMVYSEVTREFGFYERLKPSSYTIFLSKNKKPFKVVGKQNMVTKGTPILIPYQDKVLLKGELHLQSLDPSGNVEEHLIPSISIINLYNGNVALDSMDNIWLGKEINCTSKSAEEISLKSHYEYSIDGSLVKYNLNDETSQEIEYHSESKYKIKNRGRPYVHQLIYAKGKLFYDLKYGLSVDGEEIEIFRKNSEGHSTGTALSALNDYLVDNTGTLWLAGNFGLLKLVESSTAFQLIPQLGIRSFVEDEHGNIRGRIESKVFESSTSKGNCISTYDPENGTVEYTTVRVHSEGKSTPVFVHWIKTAFDKGKIYASSLIIDSEGATATRYKTNKSFPIKYGEYNLVLDRKRRLWRSSWFSELVSVHDQETNEILRIDTLPNFVDFPVEINDMYECPSTGNIWLATNGKGIYILPSEKGEIIHYDRSKRSPLPLIDIMISGLFEDKDGNMWIGHGLGLSKISKDRSAIQHFPFDPDLVERRLIYSILPDDSANFLWLSSDQGIFRYDIQKEEYIGFPLDEAVMSAEYNRTSYLKSSKGQLFYGGLIDGKRTVTFQPDEVIAEYETKAKVKAPIIISSLLKYDSYTDREMRINSGLQGLTTLKLEPGDRYFELEFAVADYRNPEQNYYSYYLDGYDHSKEKPKQSNNIVRYENLNPGTYQLVLKGGLNLYAAEFNQRTIEIIVVPFWYETTMAKIIFLLSGMGLIYLFYSYSVRKKLAKQEAVRIKELDDLKTKLYTNITHEFRTPLTVILGMNDNIEGHDQEKSLIRRNAKNLLQLINQLLNLSKLDSGKLRIHNKRGEIVGFLHYLTESFYSMASERKIDLSFSSNIDSITIEFDEVKIQHIIYNLISNAIKFTRPGGKVAINVEIPNKSDQGFYSICVKDTGIGIDETHLPFIFERFYQIETEGKSSHSNLGGSGIGLAFVKELVDLMGGEIQVKSQKAWGTEFNVLLPLPKTEWNLNMAEIQPLHSNNSMQVSYESLPSKPDQFKGDKPIVLVIEDNTGVITYIKSILIGAYAVEIAMNGQEGIELAKEIIPDIILTDVMMPEKNGYEVVTELKNDNYTSHIPIVMLTAKADLSSKIVGFEMGADAYLSKPFEKDELLARMSNLLVVRQKLQSYYSGSIRKLPVELKSSAKDSAFLEKVTSMIQDKIYDSEFSVSELPQIVFMSNTQFYRKLKALTGQTPTVFVRSLRIQKAIKLLQETDMNISEIAYEVGFTDPNYFSRVFKKDVGKVPGSFR